VKKSYAFHVGVMYQPLTDKSDYANHAALHTWQTAAESLVRKPLGVSKLSMVSLQLGRTYWKQESWAIAKMTARCALCMGALKIFGCPWLRPRLLYPRFI